MALRLKWIPRWIRWRDPFRKGAQEASDQYIGKKAKSTTLHDLLLVRDFQELGEADRAGAAALAKKHGFDTMGPSGKGDKDLWACDDMTINAGRSGLLELLVGLAIGALALWFLKDRLWPEMPPQSAAATATADAELKFYVRRADGSVHQVDIERLPAHLRPAN